jgi:hypothetical protein
MDVNVTALERAFDLAKSGECRTVGDIRSRLKQEGYSDAQIIGRQLHCAAWLLAGASPHIVVQSSRERLR